MSLTPLDAAGVAFYQTNVAALAELHRGIAALAEAVDVDTLLAQGEKLKARLRELCPNERSDGWPVQQWINEHTKLIFLAQVREMTDKRQRLFDKAQQDWTPAAEVLDSPDDDDDFDVAEHPDYAKNIEPGGIWFGKSKEVIYQILMEERSNEIHEEQQLRLDALDALNEDDARD